MKINIYDDFNKKVATVNVKISQPKNEAEQHQADRLSQKRMNRWVKENTYDSTEYYNWNWA